MSDNNKNIKSLDEIVFENRNKEYGAYDLRMSEKQTLLRALLRGGLIVLLLVGVILFSISDLAKGDKNEDISVDVELANIEIPDVPEEEEPEVVEPEPEEPEIQENHYQEETAQEKFVMPEPKPEPKVQETVPPTEDLKGKDLSFEKREGKESAGQTGGGPVNLNPEAPKNTTQAPKNDSDAPKTTPAGPATVTARTATVMAVYPGCEKEAAKGKQQAIDCMSKKLQSDLVGELEDFASIAEREGITSATAKLNFQIDTQGRITKISPQGDAKLGPEAKKALERITQKQQKKGKTIKPAQSDDGRPAVLQFNIPVRFQQM